MVRWSLLVGMGIFQAAALAPAQPGKAIGIRLRFRALRHGRGHALWHQRPQTSKAQCLRDGTQVAVERATRRPSARKFSGEGRSFVDGSARKTERRVRYFRSNRREALSVLGRATGP